MKLFLQRLAVLPAWSSVVLIALTTLVSAGETLAIVESSSYYQHDVDRQTAKMPVARLFLVDLNDFQVYRQIPTYSLPCVCASGPGRFLVASRTPPDVQPPATLIQELEAGATVTKNSFTIPANIHESWNAGSTFVPVIVSAADGFLWLKSGSVPPPEKKDLGVLYRIECIDLAQKKIVASYTFPDDCYSSLHFSMGKNCVLFLDHPNARPEILLLKPDGTHSPVKNPLGFEMPNCGTVNGRTLALVGDKDGLITVFRLNDAADGLELISSKLYEELKSLPDRLAGVSMLEEGRLAVHYSNGEMDDGKNMDIALVLNLVTSKVLIHRQMPRNSAALYFKKDRFYSLEDARLVEYDEHFKSLRSVPIIKLTGATLTK